MPQKKPIELTTDLAAMYRCHRKHYKQGWGLAWYLASEICDRFHASHGLAVETLGHDGLGFYGVGIRPLPCKANGHAEKKQLGRLSIGGDVENWISGSPGDHGLPLEERAADGEDPERFVSEAIAHLRIPPYPEGKHALCRHKRHGSSYCLLFRLSAMLALRYGTQEGMAISNGYWALEDLARRYDPSFCGKKYPGYFYFQYKGEREILIAIDGRVLHSPVPSTSLWDRYMAGESTVSLARWLISALGA